MLIPSIDLMDGRIVQLEQGRRLVFSSGDFETWIQRFSHYPMVQVIDLDAALGRGENAAIVRELCGRLPCQVGGGIRDVERARRLVDAGAHRVIVGSALFGSAGVDTDTALRFSAALTPERLVAAVDTRAGGVVIHGWQTRLALEPQTAVRALEPFAGRFLLTLVDGEGLLGGIDIPAVRAVAQATTRRLIAAGGIRSQAEVDALDALGIDAVVGMAVYRGLIDPCRA